MRKKPATSSFRTQMSQSMGEMSSIMASGASPTFRGRLTARKWPRAARGRRIIHFIWHSLQRDMVNCLQKLILSQC